jgi:hypothetical protein
MIKPRAENVIYTGTYVMVRKPSDNRPHGCLIHAQLQPLQSYDRILKQKDIFSTNNQHHAPTCTTLLYSTKWLLPVSAVACHHQVASGSELHENRPIWWYII